MTAVTAQSGAGEQAASGTAAPMPRGRRSTELLMLTFAVGVVLAAYASAGLGLNGKLPAGLIEYGLAFAALVFVAHLAVRRLAPWADPLMLPLAASSVAQSLQVGTIEGKGVRPIVLLTSNNTRELSEALKRRCLYLHIDYPSIEHEKEIVRVRVPEVERALCMDPRRVVRPVRLEGGTCAVDQLR